MFDFTTKRFHKSKGAQSRLGEEESRAFFDHYGLKNYEDLVLLRSIFVCKKLFFYIAWWVHSPLLLLIITQSIHCKTV